MKRIRLLGAIAGFAGGLMAAESRAPLVISTPMPAPEWAKLERRLLAESVAPCLEFAKKYYDDRGYVQCFVRWGANDGPDDALDRKSTRLNSSHVSESRMPSSA